MPRLAPVSPLNSHKHPRALTGPRARALRAHVDVEVDPSARFVIFLLQFLLDSGESLFQRRHLGKIQHHRSVSPQKLLSLSLTHTLTHTLTLSDSHTHSPAVGTSNAAILAY